MKLVCESVVFATQAQAVIWHHAHMCKQTCSDEFKLGTLK